MKAELCGQKRTDFLLYARCTQAGYNAFLEQHGLPYAYDPARQIHLVLTDEHAKIAPVSGGIGSYVEDLEQLSDNVWVAFLRAQYSLENFAPGYRCLHPKLFWDDEWLGRFDWYTYQDLSYLLVEQILFYYPIIQSIEYQECNGYGARIAQAKRAGLLPKSILLIARCHGSQIYLENGFERWMPASSQGQRVMILEKLSVELADIVSMPSRYLRDLYLENGFEIDAERLRMERYSYSLTMELPAVPYRMIDTLVFFGRRQLHKGYEEFLQALEVMDLANSPIKKVVIFGAKSEPTAANEEERVARLRNIVEVEEYALPRGALRSRLLSLAPTALLILPYRADNAPIAVYEVLSAGCPFLAADQGGIPEQIPEPFRRDVLVDIRPHNLAARIQTVCLVGGAARKTNIATLQAATAKMLNAAAAAAHNTVSTCYREQIEQKPPCPIMPRSDSLTAAVFLWSLPSCQLHALCEGLNAQTLRPYEVIFVNDMGSAPDQGEIEELVSRTLKLPYRFLEHDPSWDLSQARNSALDQTRTRYFIPITANTIPLPDNFRRLVYAMEHDGRAWMTTSYKQPVNEATAWQDMAALRAKSLDATFPYHPLGAGIVHSLFDGEIDNVLACYRSESIRSIGGWDSEIEATGMDWAMHLKVLNHGARLLVIPSVDYLHFERGGSMVQTSAEFSSDRLKARALVLLPRFDRYRLITLVKEVERLRSDLARSSEGLQSVLAEDLEKLHVELDSLKSRTMRLRYRAIDRMIQLTGRVPPAKRALAWTLRKSYHVWISVNRKRSRD
jgi:glycosyltransferase involved in cell wall biosynthesis